MSAEISRNNPTLRIARPVTAISVENLEGFQAEFCEQNPLLAHQLDQNVKFNGHAPAMLDLIAPGELLAICRTVNVPATRETAKGLAKMLAREQPDFFRKPYEIDMRTMCVIDRKNRVELRVGHDDRAWAERRVLQRIIDPYFGIDPEDDEAVWKSPFQAGIKFATIHDDYEVMMDALMDCVTESEVLPETRKARPLKVDDWIS